MTNDHSRRGFLAIAGTGTAVAAGAAVLGSATDAAARPAPKVPDQARTPLVAYVHDAHSGEVVVMVDDREVVVHDKHLAALIARAAHGGE
jgi:anti-sigma-K factor RskA